MSTTSALLFGIWIGFTAAIALILPLWLGHRARDHHAPAPPKPVRPERCTCDWWAQTICEACEHSVVAVEQPRRIVPLDAGTRSLELDMSGWEWKRKQARDSHGRFI